MQPNPPAIITTTGCAWVDYVHPTAITKGRWTASEALQNDAMKKIIAEKCPNGKAP